MTLRFVDIREILSSLEVTIQSNEHHVLCWCWGHLSDAGDTDGHTLDGVDIDCHHGDGHGVQGQS